MNKLKHTEGRIIVAIDLDKKNWHQFETGERIRLERKYDNFNMRYVNPTNAVVVSAASIPEGSEVLIHHNAIHDTNKIFDHSPLSGKDEADSVKYFSISEEEAYAWRDKDQWQPLPGYDFALRVFEPYTGILEGIEPTLIKDTLFLLTGIYKNQVAGTIRATDYQIIFQDVNGREGNLIRVRTEGCKKTQREPEIVFLRNDYTKKVLNNKLLVGITKADAKTIKEAQ